MAAPMTSFLLFIVFLALSAAGSAEKKKMTRYIIQVRVPSEERRPASIQSASGSDENSGRSNNDALYHTMLTSALSNTGIRLTSGGRDAGDAARSRMAYTYNEVLTGFTARLTPEELEAMSGMEWFVSAVPDRTHKTQTTHSGEFLGLHPGRGLWNISKQGQGVIIAILDTGITPNHPSFSDEGIPPPPARWKGSCEFGPPLCNNKLIGARSLYQEEEDDDSDDYYDGNYSSGSPAPAPAEEDHYYGDGSHGERIIYTEISAIDEDGHGTHTASTAAGAFVGNASASYGLGLGSAAGMAPRAHLAVYKIGATGFTTSAILKGIDEAVADGVDIISMSFSTRRPESWDLDLPAVASFAAYAKGVFLSTVAGNNGPGSGTIIHDAPWLLNVGASTTDRRMRASVRLGNGEVLEGGSLYQPPPNVISDFGRTLLPLGFPVNKAAIDLTTTCESLMFLKQQPELVGSLVVCLEDSANEFTMFSTERSENVLLMGGAGMIYVQTSELNNTIGSREFLFPATTITYSSYERILAYSNSTNRPTATIEFHGTQMGEPRSPSIPEFSSRGPTPAYTGILKPDIVGPGLGIIAAAPGEEMFVVMDGTSMSCPHLSGIAALIKSEHPDWSPAMIKSAIMTTADVVDRDGKPIRDDKDGLPASLYAMGAGNVNPEKAGDPGLVYDCSADDYIPYFCGLGYTSKQVLALTGKEFQCSASTSIPAWDLNYPSISVNFSSATAPIVVSRTVTNVGSPRSTYRAEVIIPPAVKVVVAPDTLEFSEANEKKSFKVTFQGIGSGVVEGYLKWISDAHIVQSPIVVTFN